MPHMSVYSSKGYPHDHFQNYEFLIILHGWGDKIMC